MSLYNCTIKPLHDFVVVRTVDNPHEKTPGGIWLPQTAESEPLCQVVDFGPGREGYPDTNPEGKIERGDLVVLQRHIGTKVLINNKIHMLVKLYDVQAVIDYRNEDGTKYKPELPEVMFHKKEETESNLIA